MHAVRNPPNPQDPHFTIAVSDVAARISTHLNNDQQKILLFGVGLVHQSDRTELTTIQQSQSNLQDKCHRVLELWARRSESRWEDVIAQLRAIQLSRLANELTKELGDRSEDRSQPSPLVQEDYKSQSIPGNHSYIRYSSKVTSHSLDILERMSRACRADLLVYINSS